MFHKLISLLMSRLLLSFTMPSSCQLIVSYLLSTGMFKNICSSFKSPYLEMLVTTLNYFIVFRAARKRSFYVRPVHFLRFGIKDIRLNSRPFLTSVLSCRIKCKSLYLSLHTVWSVHFSSNNLCNFEPLEEGDVCCIV